MANSDWYPVGGSGGIPSDVLSSEVIGERGVKVDQNPRLILKGNNFDRLGVQSLDYRDDTISRGFAQYLDYEQLSIDVGAKTYVEVTTPVGFYIALIDREVLTDKERLFYKVYTDYSAVTTGTQLNIGNLRSNSAFPSGTTAFECSAPTTINQDSLISNVPVFGSTTSGNRSSGGISGDSLFRLIAPNTKLLFEWENQSNQSIYCKTMLAWLELPESVII